VLSYGNPSVVKKYVVATFSGNRKHMSFLLVNLTQLNVRTGDHLQKLH